MDPQKSKSHLNSAAQQHKIIGLNARYDRMLAGIGSGFTQTARPTRTRNRSAGSSSASSYGTPKSSSGAYSRFSAPRRYSKSFSAPKWADFRDAQPRKAVQPLPRWLSDTFSSLEPDHPLRLLLPASRSHPKKTPNSCSAETLAFGRIDPSITDSIFAYQPQEPQEPSFIPVISDFRLPELTPNPLQSPETVTSCFDPQLNSSPFLSAMLADSKLGFTPFSTPGPTFYEKNASFTCGLDHVALTSDVEYSCDEEDSLLFFPNSCPPQSDTVQQQATTPVKLETESPVHPLASSPSPYYRSHQTRLPRIHFDSPTSDPMSDPPLPPHLADKGDDINASYPDLDFIWRPFPRDGTTEDSFGPDSRHLGFVLDPCLQDSNGFTSGYNEENGQEKQADDDYGDEGSDAGFVHDVEAMNSVIQVENQGRAFKPASGVLVSPSGSPAVSHSFDAMVFRQDY